MRFTNTRGSAHQTAFAAQMHKSWGRIPQLLYFFSSMFGEVQHRLSEKRSFSTVSTRLMLQHEPGFSIYQYFATWARVTS
ncbi:hypothetical protein, partial [Agathobaculum desmolans]|uniref:hypothetical protein n=1 Tax=Agathobaculum desmolans TaxID=39484 RepID=UPI00248ECB06